MKDQFCTRRAEAGKREENERWTLNLKDARIKSTFTSNPLILLIAVCSAQTILNFFSDRSNSQEDQCLQG